MVLRTTMLGRFVSGGAPGAREGEGDACPSLDIKIVSQHEKLNIKIDKQQKNISPPCA
jgi:hypothetical protein